jgi:hypothetical protein
MWKLVAMGQFTIHHLIQMGCPIFLCFTRTTEAMRREYDRVNIIRQNIEDFFGEVPPLMFIAF